MKLKKQRKKLWDLNPNCEKCGELTILPEHVPGWKTKKNGDRYLPKHPLNMATIQHLYDKLDEERNRPNHSNERRHFLWCSKCNNEDNEIKQKNREKELLWQQSGRYPRNFSSTVLPVTN